MFTDLYGGMHESSEHEGDGCIWHVSPTASHKAQGKQLAAIRLTVPASPSFRCQASMGRHQLLPNGSIL